MGYPLDLFLNSASIDEEFICSICHDVLEDPMLIETCEHIFCNSCLTDWRSSSNICPLDREPIHGIVRSPHRAFVNVLNRFKLRCKFSDQGCSLIVEHGNMKQHHSSCEHNPELMKPCTGGCGAIVHVVQMSNHNCVTYLKAQMEKKDNEIINLREELESMKKVILGVREVMETTLQFNKLGISNHPSTFVCSSSNPRVFLAIRLDGVELGRIIIELRSDVVPRTAENFRVLCTGEKGFGYKGTKLHEFLLNGDGVYGGSYLMSTNGNEVGRKCIYGKNFNPENYILKHNVPGIVAMYTSINKTCDCIFIITFKQVPQCDRRNVAFGLVVEGFNILQQIEKSGEIWNTDRILISDCGQLNN